MSNSDDTELVDIYANNCNAISGAFDISLEFSTTMPVSVGPDGRAAAMEKKRPVLIRMSPLHAKAVAVLLMEHVLGYEQQYGAIAGPSELAAKWSAMVQRLNS